MASTTSLLAGERHPDPTVQSRENILPELGVRDISFSFGIEEVERAVIHKRGDVLFVPMLHVSIIIGRMIVVTCLCINGRGIDRH